MGLLSWRVRRACQLSQQTIQAAVTVGFESNGPAASSIADLLAPAAQTSAGETGAGLGDWSKKTRGGRSTTAVGWTSYGH